MLFKLDVDNSEVKIVVANHFLNLNNNSFYSNHHNDYLDYTAEFVWKYHIEGNYLLKTSYE